MGNPKIAIVAYCRAVGFVLAVHRLSGLSLLFGEEQNCRGLDSLSL
jgi:hypothetical protein